MEIAASISSRLSAGTIKLLRRRHHAVDRRSELLAAGALLGLDDVLSEARHLLLGFGKDVEQAALIFGDDFAARRLQSRDGRVAFAQPAPLDQNLLLPADQILQLLEVDQLGAEFLAEHDAANVDLLLQRLDGGPELVDRALDTTPAVLGQHEYEVAWMYSSSANQTLVYVNATAGALSQTSTS